MGRTTEEIQRRIRELSGSEPANIQAKVIEVDEDEFTCKVDLDEGLIIEDVRLRSVINKELLGLAMIPKLESIILISRIRGANEFFVSKFSEVDKIIVTTGDLKVTIDADKVELLKGENDEVKVFFDNSSIELAVKEISLKMTDSLIELNGGQKESYLTDINKLVQKINALENSLNALKQVLTVWVPVPMDGGAVLKAAVTSWAAQLIQPVTTVNDLKDSKVKH